ncbi:transglycosylase domain-containing protein [Bacillus solimangrovi]|nr:transglycosylase domain-containing protein [Bacillus solimangrovi]
MRLVTGIAVNLLLLFIFYFVFLFFYVEWKNSEPITTYLDKQLVLNDINLKQNSVIVDMDGHVFSEIYNGEDRSFIRFNELPEQIKLAFIAAEDKQFYTHKGFDVSAILRAAITNGQMDSIEQGGSTITQQLVRNLYLSQEQTYKRKITELLYAYQIEKNITKNEILELYINAIYFGNNRYGIVSASRAYFNKPVNKLTLAESAFLAAIPNNPTYYNPLNYFEHTKERQQWILRKMLEEEMITEVEYTIALQQQIQLNYGNKIDLYHDYSTYVLHELKELVAQSDGYTLIDGKIEKTEEQIFQSQIETRVKELLESGVRIETNLNPIIQDQLKRSINKYLEDTPLEGAIVTIDNHTQQIVGLIGGKDYKNFEFHRAFQAFRQPGSSIKPLLVYAPYLNETNASINSVIDARKFCLNEYCPKNYGKATYGITSLKSAFSNSYNTTAVRLLYKIGVEKGFSYIEKFNFDKLVSSDHRLPAAVGGFTNGMSPLEMTDAYTTFTHNGAYQPARAIKRVLNADGKVLFEWNDQAVQVWSEETNEKMREMLTSVVKNGTAKATYFPTSYIGGKTGTTNDYKDFWYIGLTNKYTTGVWVGKDTPTNLEKYYHQLPHQKIWKEAMQVITK